MVADHGMVDSPGTAGVDVDDHPELLDGVVLLGGEARFRHLYCRDGAVDDVPRPGGRCWATGPRC